MVSIVVDPDVRDELMAHLRDEQVDTRPFFHPAHSLPMYPREEQFPVAERLGASGINLPSYPQLTEDEVDHVCTAIKGFVRSRG
jgi:perosamine synthetase